MRKVKLNSKPKILCIIPAHGGSQGIWRKNLARINGKPLIAWTIEVALACSVLDRVIVLSNDEEIAEVAEDWGAEVPFIGPPRSRC